MNRSITRYAPYLWLVYLGALVFQPAFDPDTTALDWVATGVMVAAFLPLYRAGLAEHDQRRLMIMLAAMAALGVVGTAVNAAAGVFVVYAAALAGRLSPVRRAASTVAVLAALAGVIFVISPVPMPWRVLAVAPIVVFVAVIGTAGMIDGEQARTRARLRLADEEIERLATIAERERIARDLHDLLGHTLSVIALKTELAGRLVRTDPEQAEREVRDVEQTARTALAEVRSAVAGYRARGLGAELVNARRALSAAAVEVATAIDLPVLPAAQEATLALALREAVTNVVRHADAEHATIRADATPDEVVLEIIDDGRGTSGPEGSGLTGMRERAAALGGHVTCQAGRSGVEEPDTRPGPDTRPKARPRARPGARPGTVVRVVLPRSRAMTVAPRPTVQP